MNLPKSLITPIALYGCETWTYGTEMALEEKFSGSAESRVLAHAVMHGLVEGQYEHGSQALPSGRGFGLQHYACERL